MKKRTASAPTFRISKAAVGKILAAIITLAKETGMDAASFQSIMVVAYEYMQTGTLTTRTAALPEEWNAIKDSVDKAAIRSAKARARAARRKEMPGTEADTSARQKFRTDAHAKIEASVMPKQNTWSPSGVPMSPHSLDGLRGKIRNAAKRSGREADYLDRLPSPWHMEGLSKTPSSVLKHYPPETVRKLCMQFLR